MSAALLRKMRDMGLSMDQAIELLDAMEEGFQKPVPELSKGALRTRKWREQKADKRHGDVTVTRHGDATKKVPEPLKNNTPSPPLKGGISPISEPSQPEKPSTTEPQKALTVWVSEIWDDTPSKGRQRSGKQLAHNALRAAVRDGANPAAVKAGLAAYYASSDATKDGGEYAKGLHRAIQNGLWQAFEPPPDRAVTDDDPWPTRLLRWRAAAYWNSEWGPKPGRPGYRGPPPTLDAEAA